MQTNNIISVFQNKLLKKILLVFSCLFCSQIAIAADSSMPKTFSSAGIKKETSLSQPKVVLSSEPSKTDKTQVMIKSPTLKAMDSQAIPQGVMAKSVTASDEPKKFSIFDIKPGSDSDAKAENSLFNKSITMPMIDSKKIDLEPATTKTLSISDMTKKPSSVSSLLLDSNAVINTKESDEADEDSDEGSVSDFTLADAPEYIGGVTFEADEEQLSALPIIKGLYELSSEAQNMHNTKQQLPAMRKPFLEYEKTQKRHAQAIARLARSVISARDYLANYYGTSKADEVWFGKGCHYKETILGQKCSPITGCRKPYNATQFEPVTSYNIVCSDDVFALTDYAKMRGLLGEAISAYKMAKAEVATDLDITEDNFEEATKAEFGTTVIDNKLSALDSDGQEKDSSKKSMNFLQSEKSLSENELSAIGGGIEENPEKSAESASSMREQNLVRWQIGSVLAQKVGQDMADGGQIYGVPHTVYPLWEDEKRVYNQYLKEKYKNMELYFSSDNFNLIDFDLAKALNETLNVSEEYIATYTASLAAQLLNASEIKQKVDALRKQLEEEKEILKAQNERDIENARQKFEQSINKVSSISELKVRQENEMLALEEKAQADISNAKSVRQRKYNEIDEILERLNQTKDEYQEKLSKQEEARSLAGAQDRSIALEDQKKNRDPEYVSGFKDDAIATKLQNLKIVVDLQPQIDSLKKQIDTDQNKVKQLKAELALMGETEAEIKKAYIKNAVLMEKRHHEEMKQALEAREGNSVLSGVLMASALLEANDSVKSMLGVAGNLRENFKELAKAEVRSAYQDISSFENLYTPQTYQKILARHQKMLENIKKLQQAAALQSLTKFVFGGVVFGSSGFPIFECSDCQKEDVDYYVGFEGTKRDFMAPKRIAQSYTPPLREVFHFDAVDLDTINKYEPENGEITFACPPIGCPSSINPKTTKSEFLKLGQKLPDIWKRILGPRGFVERDIDIEDILMEGAKPVCGEGFLSAVCPASKLENSSRIFLAAKGERYVPNVGELSVFFKYDNGLTLTDAVMDLYDEYENADESFTGGENPSEEEITKHANLIFDLEKRFLARTQIGDVLQFVDMEQTYQKSLDQLKVKIDETRHTIDEYIEKLFCKFTKKDTDYLRPGEESSRIVSSEFIADDETYEAISQCLDEGKNKYIQAALDFQNELPVLTDDIKEIKKKSDDMILCMQKDNEELVILSDNTQPSTELDEQIKSERVNGQVSGKYRQEADKQANKDQLIPLPYKADFGPGDPYNP